MYLSISILQYSITLDKCAVSACPCLKNVLASNLVVMVSAVTVGKNIFVIAETCHSGVIDVKWVS